MDVNTSGHLNFFAYRLSKTELAVKIVCLEPLRRHIYRMRDTMTFTVVARMSRRQPNY
ncbi:hypothetical protein ATHEMM101B_18390 [Atlantibacter hermannii]|nr:Uncharacterised protein [Atlantibacter hermannii]